MMLNVFDYISYIYHNNDSVYLSAPTGFGKSFYFLSIIAEELTKNRRKCLVISPMMMILNEMNDGFYKFLNSNDIENRTRDYIEFKNGSLIEFKSSIAIRGGRHSREIDILYIDEIRENDISWNYISHLFNNFNKLIIVNTLPSDKIKYIFKDITKGKYLIKDINKNTDFITELRGFKIEKIREKYENRFKYNIPRESY